jgi:Zn finger protein HypA/HybF involved in hydrogenase expression
MSDDTILIDEEPVDAEDEVVEEAEPSPGQLKQSFKCSRCRAKMEFKPGSLAQTCPYCGHENPIP